MITEKHKEALAAIKELKGEKIGASMILELVDLVETLDASLDAFTAKATEIARAADLITQERNELRAEVKEWLCIECNTVYPGPPQAGFSCVQCPKCGGKTGPHLMMEIRDLEATYRRQSKELEIANANLSYYQNAVFMPEGPTYEVQHGGVVPAVTPVRLKELFDKLAAQTIPDGWTLYEADFSLCSEETPGMVTLVRAGEDFSNWHLLPEADFYVYPLYVHGPGLTYEAALREAIKCAHEVPPIPKGGA